jgi:hypothetical protein
MASGPHAHDRELRTKREHKSRGRRARSILGRTDSEACLPGRSGSESCYLSCKVGGLLPCRPRALQLTPMWAAFLVFKGTDEATAEKLVTIFAFTFNTLPIKWPLLTARFRHQLTLASDRARRHLKMFFRELFVISTRLVVARWHASLGPTSFDCTDQPAMWDTN